MFQISQAVRKFVLASAAAALVTLLTPYAASAAAPAFSWTDSDNTAITASGGPFQGNVQLTKQAQAGGTIAFAGQTKLNCGGQPASVSVELDVANSDYKTAYPTPAQAFVTKTGSKDPTCKDSGIEAAVQIAQASSSGAAPGNQTSKECDQGGFSWLACPLMDNISTAVTGVAQKALTPLLQVEPLSKTTTPGLYQAWTNIKHVAEVLFVFIFMAAVFSSALQAGLDQYTIKRILPRLVAAAIIIQFSFFISAFLVDLGNVLGAGINDVILANFNTGSSHNAGINVLANIGVLAPALAVGGYAVFANWVMILPILLLLLIGVLAILLTLAARYMIIAILVAISPLAILAWVLPNTEHHFKKWFSFLFRLILMYPLIIGVLAVVSRLTEILGFTDGTTTNGFANFLTDVIKPFLLIAALLVVPFAFKWAGSLMHQAHSVFGRLSSQGRGKVKSSDWYSEKKQDQQAKNLDRMKRADNKLSNMKYLGGAKGRAGIPGRAMAGMARGAYGAVLAGAPSTARAIEKKHSQYVGAYNKELGDLEAAQDVGALMNIINASYGSEEQKRKAMRSLEANAPELMRYTRTEAGRMATMKKLADMGLVSFSMMDNIAKYAPYEFGDAKRAAGKNFKAKSTLFTRWSEGEVEITDDGQQIVHHAGEVNERALRGVVANWDTQTVKADIAPDNWDVARKDPAISRIFAEVHDPLTYKAGLSDNSRTRFQRAKRLEIIKWAATRRDGAEFQTDHGKKIYNAIASEVQRGHNDDIYEDLIKFAWEGKEEEGLAAYRPDFTEFYNSDPKQWDHNQRHRYLQKWLGIDELPPEPEDEA